MPEYETAEQLYTDPGTCIECDACFEVCPVEAIYPDRDLPQLMLPYLRINAEYFAPVVKRARVTGLRVAVVGSGPAGMYTVGACSPSRTMSSLR